MGVTDLRVALEDHVAVVASTTSAAAERTSGLESEWVVALPSAAFALSVNPSAIATIAIAKTAVPVNLFRICRSHSLRGRDGRPKCGVLHVRVSRSGQVAIQKTIDERSQCGLRMASICVVQEHAWHGR